jgi:diguanylate cyclase (GGDEF)-like protein
VGIMPGFMDPASGVFGDRALRELLTLEVNRATRYQDFFSLCLVKPHVGPSDSDQTERIEEAVSRKIAQFLRSTDMVGRTREGIAILLLNTPHAEAVRIVERLCGRIESVAFRGAAGDSPLRITLGIALVFFPRDGVTDAALFSRAQALLQEASQSGDSRVVCISEPSQ